MTVAFVILAHADPVQVRRLVAALDPAPVFLHCDARTSPDVFRAMAPHPLGRVRILPRRPTHLASWSLVAAELDGLRAAYAGTSADHIVVMSAADYPLTTVPQIERELEIWEGRSWLPTEPLPWPGWNTRFRHDGGLWRLQHRFLTRRDQSVVYLGNVPLRSLRRRALPADVELRGSSQWKIMSRGDVQLLMEVVDARRDLVEFWRTTLVPEESFVASVLSSPSIVGDRALPVRRAHPWFMDWPETNSDHPRWLDRSHLDALAAARSAPPLAPNSDAVPGQPYRKLFARKFGSNRSEVLLDLIDTELHQR